MRIMYSESVFVSLIIQNAKRMLHNVMCGLPRTVL
jgi:hypothetical protein